MYVKYEGLRQVFMGGLMFINNAGVRNGLEAAAYDF